MAVVLLGTAAPATLLAQPSAEALAQVRYEQGMRAFDGREFRTAREHFAAALELTGSPNVRFMLARTLRELGVLDEAVLEFRLTAREAGERGGTEPRFRATAQAAARAVAELEPQLARVLLRVTPTPAQVRFDARELPAEALGVELPVLAGAHTLRVTAPGFTTHERRVTTPRGELTRIEVTLTPEQSSVAPPRTEPPPDERPTSTQSNVPMLAAGVTLLAVGVTGVVLAAVYGPATLDAWSTVDRLCDATRQCQPGAADAVRNGPTYEVLSVVGLGAAGVGLITGGVLLGLGWPRSVPVQPTVSLGGVGCTVRF